MIAVVLFVIVRKSQEKTRIEEEPEGSAPSVIPSLTVPSPIAMPSPAVSVVPIETSQTQVKKNSWSEFQAQYGRGMKARFLPGGQLVSIQGNFESAFPAAEKDFRSDQASMVLDRAKKILDSASSMLGLESEFPLGTPQAQLNNVSAQVHFKQSYQGIPLAPLGSVTLQFGPKGELLSLDSSYVPRVKIRNQIKLTQDQAEHKVLGSAVEGGRVVIWVTNPLGEPEGRFAYEYWQQGRQVIVDATDGKILFRRDRRNF